MRTTVTLDDDLALRLQARARERDVSFKRVLNDAVRSGLGDEGATEERYAMETSPMRARPGLDLIKALASADELEDEEAARKLEQGR